MVVDFVFFKQSDLQSLHGWRFRTIKTNSFLKQIKKSCRPANRENEWIPWDKEG